MLVLHWQSVVAFFTILLGYQLVNLGLQWWFYVRSARRWNEWKTQPSHAESLQQPGRWKSLWVPLLTQPRTFNSNTVPWARAVPTINIVLVSCIGCTLAECIMTGRTRVVFSVADGGGIAVQLGLFLLANVQQQASVYYLHRLMHVPPLYKWIHKQHHLYTAPEPFDDLYANPVEIALFYSVLVSPPFLLPLHIKSYFVYMLWHALTGLLEHSGVNVRIPGLYSATDHDKHHMLFDSNYGFPMPLFDIFHGTYTGELWGRRFSATQHMAKSRKRNRSTVCSEPVVTALLWAIVVLAGYITVCDFITQSVVAGL